MGLREVQKSMPEGALTEYRLSPRVTIKAGDKVRIAGRIPGMRYLRGTFWYAHTDTGGEYLAIYTPTDGWRSVRPERVRRG
jgi:hypothetical protein